jgi:hypothetical protein
VGGPPIEPGLLADPLGVRLDRPEARLVDAVRAARDDQEWRVADAEHERLADLRHLAADGGRRLGRRPRPVRELADLGVDARLPQDGPDAVERAHAAAVGTRRAISWSVRG